ncbi:MAG TPA: DUF167 domain-containing protein [Verrucomicrobiae bacterium]|jgi:hypothetical protein
MPSFLTPHGAAVHLSVKVQPRASRNEILGAAGNELRIKVTAPPVDAAANEALLRLLADKLDCARGAVQIVRGHTSRHKTVAIQGLTAAEVMAKLMPGA